MTTDYSFFENSLDEQRTYKFLTGWHSARFLADVRDRTHGHKLDLRPHIKILKIEKEVDEDNGYPEELVTVLGSHVMLEGEPTGLNAVESEFGIQLPEELHHFYRRWNGGFLLFREFYELFSIEEIIGFAKTLDGGPNRPPNTPWYFLRFCKVLDSCELALRRRFDGDWEVVFVEPFDTGNFEKYLDCEQNPAIDGCFSTWLKRMCATDGWPIGEGIMGMIEDEPPSERLN